MRKNRILASLLVFGGIFGLLSWTGRFSVAALAPDCPDPADKGQGPSETAVRKTSAAFIKAFNAADARAVAALWSKDGEFVGADGETIRGRAAIEKTYVEFFRQNPKAKIEVEIQSVRLLGRHTALEEGSLKLQLPGEK